MILAYIDPGIGALLWQTIIAAFVGFLFYLKKTRRWIVEMFRNIFRRGKKNQGVGLEIPPPKVEAKIDAK
jgi:O-antigen/teichoic acid export membrane protein